MSTRSQSFKTGDDCYRCDAEESPLRTEITGAWKKSKRVGPAYGGEAVGGVLLGYPKDFYGGVGSLD